VLAGIGLFLIFFEGKLSWGKRVKHCVCFGMISVLLLAINLIRNEMVMHFATGERQKSSSSLLQNMEYFGNVLSDWLLIPRQPFLSVLLTIVVLLTFLIGMLWCYYRRKSQRRYEYIAAATGFFYCVFMLVSATLSRYEQFTSRLLSPMFIPMVWCAGFWVPSFVAPKQKAFRSIFMAGSLGVAAALLAGQLSAAYETWDGVKDAGIPGYFEDPFPQREIVQFIENYKGEFKPGYSIYSNAGDAVYIFTGLAAKLLPQDVFPKEIQKYYHEQNNYLVWFNDVDNPDLLDEKSVIRNKSMILIKRFTDGAVYVTPDSASLHMQ
jgi:hypothetical protein